MKSEKEIRAEIQRLRHQLDRHRLARAQGELLLETAARHVGFIEGVEYCKQLLRAGGVQ